MRQTPLPTPKHRVAQCRVQHQGEASVRNPTSMLQSASSSRHYTPTIWSSIRTRPCLHRRSLDQWWSTTCITCSSPAPVAYTLTVWRRGHEAEEATWLKRRPQTSKYATSSSKMGHRVILRWSRDRVSCSPTEPNLPSGFLAHCDAKVFIDWRALQRYPPVFARKERSGGLLPASTCWTHGRLWGMPSRVHRRPGIVLLSHPPKQGSHLPCTPRDQLR